MFICGSNLVGGNLAYSPTPTNLENIDYVEIKNGIYDDLYITKAVNFEFSSEITQGWDFDTILWAAFGGNTNAGNVDWNLETVSHLIIKKRNIGSFEWKTIVVKEISEIEDFRISYNDYTCPSGVDIQYALVPVLYGTEGNYSSAAVKSEFSGMFIIEGESYLHTDITDGFCNTTRNIPSTNVELLNKKYPVFIKNSIANYDTGTCVGSFITDECDIENSQSQSQNYSRVVFQRSAMDLISDGIPKILKLNDGRIWLVQVTPNPTDTASESYANRNVSFSWIEIGDVNSEEDLYYLGLSNVTEEWWNK